MSKFVKILLVAAVALACHSMLGGTAGARSVSPYQLTSIVGQPSKALECEDRYCLVPGTSAACNINFIEETYCMWIYNHEFDTWYCWYTEYC